ncbi:transaldolase family protein [Pasteuria penetrans]|uniref:transaldolase family protein n=1 Tax=Pasteuria penetrans TaxID=86005 RepID=UPI000FA607D9|nr:transaldolase family protein [Pasteuria penetrans]
MKFFLDTAKVDEAEETRTWWGVISGITTNPTLLVSAKRTQEEVVAGLLAASSGTVHAEVVGEVEQMVEDGRRLAEPSPRIVIKVPASPEGLEATHRLSQEGIRVNVTLVFTVNQALLAARSGASFVSPFVGRLEDNGEDGVDLVRRIVQVFSLHALPTLVLAASLRTPDHVTRVALAGAHIATVPHHLLTQLLRHPLTEQGIQRFEQDWRSVKKSG